METGEKEQDKEREIRPGSEQRQPADVDGSGKHVSTTQQLLAQENYLP